MSRRASRRPRTQSPHDEPAPITPRLLRQSSQQGLRADIEAIEINIEILREGLQREQRYLEDYPAEQQVDVDDQTSQVATQEIGRAKIRFNITLFQEALVREQTKLRQLHESTQELARLEELVTGSHPLDTNDLDGDDRSDLSLTRAASKKIGRYVTKWSYNILRPTSVYSKTYATTSSFLSEYDTLKSLYTKGLSYWPTDIGTPEQALSNYDQQHTGIMSRINIFKQSLEKIEFKYDETIEKFRHKYNDDDGSVGHMVTEQFLEPFETLQDRLATLRTRLVSRTGERSILDRIHRAGDQCTQLNPTHVETVISNILAILPSLGPIPKQDGTANYNYYDIYGWLNSHQFLRRGHAPNLAVIWETFLDDNQLHVPVSEPAKRYLRDHCLPASEETLEQPPAIDCNLIEPINRQHFVNCRASGRSNSPACQNFCENVASQPRNLATFGNADNCRSALDATPWPDQNNYTMDCHDPDSTRRQTINNDLDRVKAIARQYARGSTGVIVPHHDTST